MTPPDSTGRRAFRKAAAVLAWIALSWTVILLVTGGFDTQLFGNPFTAHQPRRPVLWGALALSLFMLSGGDDLIVGWALVATKIARRLLAAVWPTARLIGDAAVRWHVERFAALALAVAVVVAGVARGSKVGGGADSYGYVSETDLWISGRVSVSQPWVHEVPWPGALAVAAPLGYRPGPEKWTFTPPVVHPDRDPWAIVPTYASGLPLLMAAAKIVAGHCAIFWIAPLSGGVLVFLTFAIGHRMGTPGAGLMAAWFVANSPNVLEMSLAPMSDVPVAAAWAVTYWALLGRTRASAVGAAVAGSIAILVRPNLFFMCGPVGLVLAYALWSSSGTERRRQWVRAVVVTAGLGLGVATAASINWAIYGSPFMSGYGTLRDVLDWAHVAPNFSNYTQWFVKVHSVIGLLGIAALFVPVRALWPGVPRRAIVPLLGVFVLGVWIEYMFWGVFETELYLRFLLSTWPFIMLGLANVLLAPSRLAPPAPGRWLAFAAVLVALVLGTRWLMAADASGIFTQRVGESKYVTAAEITRASTPDNSVVFAMQHSGSVRYYAGRVTLRYDLFPGGWLDRSVTWLSERGVHPYALLDDWERDRLGGPGGESVAALLRRPPIFTYREVALYDLAPGPAGLTKTEVFPDSAADLRCVAPAPPPTLVFRK